jgi:hypothetical protein
LLASPALLSALPLCFLSSFPHLLEWQLNITFIAFSSICLNNKNNRPATQSLINPHHHRKAKTKDGVWPCLALVGGGDPEAPRQ